MTATELLAEIVGIGRDGRTGGYTRLAWGPEDVELRRWFAERCRRLGLDVGLDRNGNCWAWWGRGLPGTAMVLGSHLDSVPGGGPLDGPLGIASALAAVELLRADGWQPGRPVAIVVFADEEGARFGVACVGSRLLTGALEPRATLGVADAAGVTMAEAMRGAGVDPDRAGRDDELLATVGEYVELHIEQGTLPVARGAGVGAHGLAAAGAPLGLAECVWPHGRWRVEAEGRPNHAGTTPMTTRADPVVRIADTVLAARASAIYRDALATVGRVVVSPGAVNAIAEHAVAWLDVRAMSERRVRQVLADVVQRTGLTPVEESWSPGVDFDRALTDAVAEVLGGDRVPVLPAGAGHDAAVLAAAGVPSAMVFVRNPTGVSHAPDESASAEDIEAGVRALTALLRVRARAASAPALGHGVATSP